MGEVRHGGEVSLVSELQVSHGGEVRIVKRGESCGRGGSLCERVRKR